MSTISFLYRLLHVQIVHLQYLVFLSTTACTLFRQVYIVERRSATPLAVERTKIACRAHHATNYEADFMIAAAFIYLMMMSYSHSLQF